MFIFCGETLQCLTPSKWDVCHNGLPSNPSKLCCSFKPYLYFIWALWCYFGLFEHIDGNHRWRWWWEWRQQRQNGFWQRRPPSKLVAATCTVAHGSARTQERSCIMLRRRVVVMIHSKIFTTELKQTVVDYNLFHVCFYVCFFRVFPRKNSNYVVCKKVSVKTRQVVGGLWPRILQTE